MKDNQINEVDVGEFYEMFTSQLAEAMENRFEANRKERMMTETDYRAIEIISKFLRTHNFETYEEAEADVVHGLMERYPHLVDVVILSRAELN